MKKRQIVNIVNFVRGVEPRCYVDLMKPVTEQIRLLKEYGLRGTFLLQYDVLILPEYTEIFKLLDSKQFEIGVWHEVVEPQVKAAGLSWRGRYPWDWHTHCGFPVGYTKSEREKLVDALYEKFHEVFGYYPRVFGSWFFDTHTIRYINDRYGIDALCNCKEQYGTDGYTLWGGYYGQGYYPSSGNVFMPAQSEDKQISVPLFRMLGSDPVYQYDYQIDPQRDELVAQEVITLEPTCKGEGGGSPNWVDWYMRENFSGECLSFGYTQAGQENSFGWENMERGLSYQMPLFKQLQDEGKIVVETLGETGRWFKENYSSTPASAIVAHTACDDERKNSVWYSTKFYRVNLYGDHGNMRIRDIHIFDQSYPDTYEDNVCTENHAAYEALPLIDGCRYTGNGVIAGGYITYDDGSVPTFDEMVFTDEGGGRAAVTYGDMRVELYESGLRIVGAKPFTFENRIGIDGGHLPLVTHISSKQMKLSYGGMEYAVRLARGRFSGPLSAISEGNVLEMNFSDISE